MSRVRQCRYRIGSGTLYLAQGRQIYHMMDDTHNGFELKAGSGLLWDGLPVKNHVLEPKLGLSRRM